MANVGVAEKIPESRMSAVNLEPAHVSDRDPA